MSTAAELDSVLRTDFLAFVEMVFRTVNPSTIFLPNWSLEAIAHQVTQVIAGKTNRLIINVPPRSLKSLIISVALPAFLLGHNPGIKVLCVSHSAGLARQFSRETRMVVESDWYKRIFPRTVFSKLAEDLLETTANGARRATSFEAGITGHGGSVLIIDDPHDGSEITSAAARDTVIRIYLRHAVSASE